MFVSGRVAISAAGVTDEKDITSEMDVMFIRPKMDYGTRQRVIGAASKLVDKKIEGNRHERRAARKAGKKDVDVDIGAYQLALLAQNILGWQGPSFANVSCVPANIERLDTDEPLVAMVLKEIGERNAGTAADEPEDDEDDDPNVIEIEAKPTGRSRAISPPSA